MNKEKSKQIRKFIATRELFTWREFSTFLSEIGTENLGTQQQILRNHINAKRIKIIRRGLYLSVNDAFEPNEIVPDPYLVAGKASDDAVLGYHSALEYHGFAYSVFFQSTYLVHDRIKPFNFQNHNYISTLFPASLVRKKQEYIFCETIVRSGVSFKITSIERTFVDALDRLNLSGGSEEVIRSLEMIHVLNIKDVVDYAIMLGNGITISRVGYILECLKEQLYFDDSKLKLLESYIPKIANYFDDSRKEISLIKRWNILVPREIRERLWEETLWEDESLLEEFK